MHSRVVGVRIGCRAYPAHGRDGDSRTDRNTNIMHAKKRNIAFPLSELTHALTLRWHDEVVTDEV